MSQSIWPRFTYSRLGDQSNSSPESSSPHISKSFNLQNILRHPRKVIFLVILGSTLGFILLLSVTVHPLSLNTQYETGSESSSQLASADEQRPLILYAYHETDNARENALFFIHHGLHDGADFIFILNGKSDLKHHIPKARHIQIIERDNDCYDLGSYAEVLSANNKKLANQYKRFIMLNASIRGPFLPVWSTDCWSEAYLRKVTDVNKLVGMSFNCRPVIGTRHIQSMIIATDNIGVGILLNGVISSCFGNWTEAVHAEAGITGAILDAGYTVSALMTAFSSDPHYVDNCDHGDILFNDVYYGTNIHPYETMFQKANRNIYPEQLRLLTEWHDKAKYSSQSFCGKQRKDIESKAQI